MSVVHDAMPCPMGNGGASDVVLEYKGSQLEGSQRLYREFDGVFNHHAMVHKAASFGGKI